MSLLRRAVLLGAPLVLVVLELFHARNLEPTVYQALSLGMNRWIVVHVAQLVLFGLMGLAVYLLVEEYRGIEAAVCKVSAGVFVLFYGAFDVLAGIAPGILVKSAGNASEEELPGFEAATQAVFESAETGGFAFLKVFGEIGWFVAVMSAVVVMSRTTRPLPAFILLAPATVLLPVLQSSYTDPVGILGVFVVAALVALVGAAGRAPLLPLVFLALSAVLLTFGHPAPFGSLAFLCFFLGAYFAGLSPGGRSGGSGSSGGSGRKAGPARAGRSGRIGRGRDAVY